MNYSTIFQLLTVDGANGVNGAHATQSVLEALKNEPEPATPLHLRTVERNARGLVPKLRAAMTIHPVQVISL